MLRITMEEVASEQRWTLQGRLTQKSVSELISSWHAARDLPSAQHRIVELNDVTVIDKSGEEVLSMMIAEGAKLVANGLYTKHLLEALYERIAHPRDSS